MTVRGPSARWLYVFDGTANLGVNLTGTDGQVGAYNPPAVNHTLQDLSGSASINPVVVPVGHDVGEDVTIPLWADSTLQGLIDDWHGTTASDRSNSRLMVFGWYAADAAGVSCDIAEGLLKSVKPVTPQAELTRLETVWSFDDAPHVGAKVLLPLSAKTADGDTKTTSINNSASSADGGWGCFGYTTYTADGATGIAPRIIDSTDDSTYGALITFTTVTATTGGGQGPTFVSGTIEQYVACDWDFTGSPGAGTTATMFFAFKRL